MLLWKRQLYKDVTVWKHYRNGLQALVKKKEQFSGRPRVHIIEQFAKGNGLVFLDYGAKWKSQRKFGLSTLRG